MMQVAVFDEEHEDDLSESVNAFLAENEDARIIDIKFSTAAFEGEEEQIFCFSAMIIYSYEVQD